MKKLIITAVLTAFLLTGCSVAAAPNPGSTQATAPKATLLTAEEAKAIALENAGFTADQVSGLRADFDREDGKPEWEVEFHQGGFEYDYTVHAETGKILESDKDRDD